MLAIEEALSVIVRLIERSQQAGEPIDHTMPGYADELVRQLEICYALEPKQVISQLKLPKFVASMLWETYYPTPDNDVMS